MTDKKCSTLISLSAGDLQNIGSGPKSILSNMMADVLSLARVREKTSPKYIHHTQKEWMWINPFLTEQEAQSLVDNPPQKKLIKLWSREFEG